MSLKLIVLAALVAVVTPSPTPLVGAGLGGGLNANVAVKPWWSGWCRHDGNARVGFKSSQKSSNGGFLNDDYKYQKGDNILQPFGYLARGVTNNAGDASSILSGISSLKYPGNFDDSIDVMLRMALAARGIINVQIPGLGSIFGNSAMAIARIVNCIVDKRTDLTPAVCNNNYGSKWGWPKYTGGYNNAEDVLKFYDLLKVRPQIDDLVGKYTNGRGVGSLTGTNKIIVELVNELARLLENNDNKWSRDDLVTAYDKVSSMMGLLGNSYNDGLGDDLVDSMIDYCNDGFKSRGYSGLDSLGSDIRKRISGCGRSDFNGALRLASDANNNISSIGDSRNNLGIDDVNDGIDSGLDRTSSASSNAARVGDSSDYNSSSKRSSSHSSSSKKSSESSSSSSSSSDDSASSDNSFDANSARNAGFNNEFGGIGVSRNNLGIDDVNDGIDSGLDRTSSASSNAARVGDSSDYNSSSKRSSSHSSSSKKSSESSSSLSSSSDDSASSDNSFDASSARNADLNNEIGSSNNGLNVEEC
ncbi:mediator of RNA polymerase II transcription subunit 1-like isoform X1 [Galleria mellonella]|uniref:Mediator of RNA polymerase II transcription subunit 1-like isoform X1 n=1 Tax=Galleria mellonella TaxID=7137 RepID=A0ABM3MAL4_GALME|nr:mediator of RNA polymerase II transcription subunit 1-like isoform X1 [Galleria mellonella]